MATQPPGLRARSVAAHALALGVVAALSWMAVVVNHRHACELGETIAAPFCAPPPPGSDTQATALRTRIARNPGDANAYTELTLADRAAARDGLLALASQFAPREPNLMLRRAADALDRRDDAAAVPLLIELADKREVQPAVFALEQLVQAGQGALLEPYLQPGNRWFGPLLDRIRTSGHPFSGALPLVIAAMKARVIDEDTVHGLVHHLKDRRQWADAYALWLAVHGRQVPVLFNASFDEAFEPDGFDWEVLQAAASRRTGVTIERRRIERRGSVLDLQFTGKPLTLPVIRQVLFLAPGRYRLRGEYMGRQFRSESGLAWVVRCGAAAAGTSLPLEDTGGLWTRFQFEFAVPASCGLVAFLQLETAEAVDAVLGARGRAAFDALSLERLD